MLQIALPNKGALAGDALELVREAGYRCRRIGRELMVPDTENGVTFIFLRPRDIAIYVSNGVLDLGITGRDLLADSDAELKELLPLRFGKARLSYAVPRDSALTPEAFAQHRIATSYPHLVTQDLAQRGVSARIVHRDGAVDGDAKLGRAPRHVGGAGARHQRLGRNAAVVDAGAAKALALDDRDFHAGARQARRERRMLIVDHTKFEARSLEVVFPLDHLDELVTDAPLPPVLGDALSAAAVTVHVARAPAPRQRFVNRESRTAPGTQIC